MPSPARVPPITAPNRSGLLAISRKQSACQARGPEDHFADERKMVALGSGAFREIADAHIDRFACYHRGFRMPGVAPGQRNPLRGRLIWSEPSRRIDQESARFSMATT